MSRWKLKPFWHADDFDGRQSLSALMWIAVSSLVSFVVVACLFPDLLIHRSNHLMYTHDLCMPLEDTFILVSQFFHGGLALWDRFDQMNFAYAHLTGGFYTVVNFVVAGIYILVSKFLPYPGEVFHSVYTLCFHAVTIFIRTSGGYLLLRHFCRRQGIVFISLVIFNTLLSSFMYTGLFANNLYSYFPLMIYFVIRIFDRRRWDDVLVFIVLMMICVANSALFALSYFYDVVHFFILCAILFSCFIWRNLRLDLKKIKISRAALGKTLVAVVLCLAIMAPSLILFKSLKQDFLVADSGLGGTKGRLNNLFSPSGYFHAKGRTDLDMKYFLPASLNYLENVWGSFYLFIGGSVIFLSLIGCVLVRNRWIGVVVTTIVLILLVNERNPPGSVWALPHWLNVVTNPFAFLLRSFHMSYILMTYLYLPLVALGLMALRACFKNDEQTVVRSRIPLAIGGCIVLTILFAFILPFQLRAYALGIGLLFTTILYLGWEHNRMQEFAWGLWVFRYRKYLAAIFLAAVGVIEFRALSVYAKSNEFIFARIQPRVFPMLQDQTPMILDFQNPKVLPLREHFRFNMQTPLIHAHQNHYGFFYGFMPMERFMRELSIYEPRPLLYRDWPVRDDVKRYLSSDTRWLFTVPMAISSNSTKLQTLVEKGLQRKIVMLEAPTSLEQNILGYIPPQVSDVENVPMKESSYPLSWSQVRVLKTKWGSEYSWPLPVDFPKELTTTVFGEDRNRIKCTLGNVELKPSQGKLIVQGTFDVGNVHDGRLSVLLPEDRDVRGMDLTLTVQPSPIKGVWLNQHDRMGLTYDVSQNGWLVIHYPFDPKWRITVDGKHVQVFRANEFFMAIAVTQGEHKILFEYWPQTPLRGLIMISVVLSLIFLGWITISVLGDRRA
ncbi:MAG: YfhO family protein [Candidatus Omnitrophica bacterium]|nr:YfhO family protein [Candidatus Omnitrophota bacterium]